MDNKTSKTWETKFKVPESNATRCPKLNTIIAGVVRKDSLDEDRELSRLQNFMLDTGSPLVAAFEELRKDEPDPDCVSATIQQALLFLDNASAHFSQIQCTKILKRQKYRAWPKTWTSLSLYPTYSVRELSRRSRSVWMQSACSRGPLIQSLNRRTFFEGLLSNKQDQEEQISDTGPLSTLKPKPKRFRSKKDLLKDKPPRSGSMNSTSNRQQKSNSVSVAINTCILASYVVNCSINNNCFHSTPSLSPNLALQWVQEKLVPNSPPQHSSSTGRLCMVLTNWKQLTSDPWVLEAI